jgi:hypothetical protein
VIPALVDHQVALDVALVVEVEAIVVVVEVDLQVLVPVVVLSVREKQVKTLLQKRLITQ